MPEEYFLLSTFTHLPAKYTRSTDQISGGIWVVNETGVSSTSWKGLLQTVVHHHVESSRKNEHILESDSSDDDY